MNTPTRQAPHIWWKVRLKISPSWAALSLPIASSNTATMIQVARMALPPMRGAKLNTAVTVGLADVQVAASAEQPTAWALNQLTFGSGDHGPVQAATTIRSTTNGSHACA